MFILALLLDAVYQLIELHTVYPGEMIIVAFVLAILPYVILRGPAMRVARMIEERRQHEPQTPPNLRNVP